MRLMDRTIGALLALCFIATLCQTAPTKEKAPPPIALPPMPKNATNNANDPEGNVSSKELVGTPLIDAKQRDGSGGHHENNNMMMLPLLMSMMNNNGGGGGGGRQDGGGGGAGGGGGGGGNNAAMMAMMMSMMHSGGGHHSG